MSIEKRILFLFLLNFSVIGSLYANKPIQHWLSAKNFLLKHSTTIKNLGVSALVACQLGIGVSGCAIFSENERVKSERLKDSEKARPIALGHPARGSKFYPKFRILSNQEYVERWPVRGLANNTGRRQLTIPYNPSSFIANRALMLPSDYNELFVYFNQYGEYKFGIIENDPGHRDFHVYLLDGELTFTSSEEIQGFYLGRHRNRKMREVPIDKASFIPLTPLSTSKIKHGSGTLYGKTIELFSGELDILHVGWYIPSGTDTVIEVRPLELYAVKEWKFTHIDDDNDNHLPW